VNTTGFFENLSVFINRHFKYDITVKRLTCPDGTSYKVEVKIEQDGKKLNLLFFDSDLYHLKNFFKEVYEKVALKIVK